MLDVISTGCNANRGLFSHQLCPNLLLKQTPNAHVCLLSRSCRVPADEKLHLMLVCDIISSTTPHPAHHHDQSENPLRRTQLVGSILSCHLFSRSQGQAHDIISCFVAISSWLVSLSGVSFLVSSIIMYLVCISITLGAGRPLSSQLCFAWLYFPLLFSIWSSVPVPFSLSKSSS
jgi:hypothetical protein